MALTEEKAIEFGMFLRNEVIEGRATPEEGARKLLEFQKQQSGPHWKEVRACMIRLAQDLEAGRPLTLASLALMLADQEQDP